MLTSTSLHVKWCPYTADVLNELPDISLAGDLLWRARVPIICIDAEYVINELPDIFLVGDLPWKCANL